MKKAAALSLTRSSGFISLVSADRAEATIFSSSTSTGKGLRAKVNNLTRRSGHAAGRYHRFYWRGNLARRVKAVVRLCLEMNIGTGRRTAIP